MPFFRLICSSFIRTTNLHAFPIAVDDVRCAVKHKHSAWWTRTAWRLGRYDARVCLFVSVFVFACTCIRTSLQCWNSCTNLFCLCRLLPQKCTYSWKNNSALFPFFLLLLFALFCHFCYLSDNDFIIIICIHFSLIGFLARRSHGMPRTRLTNMNVSWWRKKKHNILLGGLRFNMFLMLSRKNQTGVSWKSSRLTLIPGSPKAGMNMLTWVCVCVCVYVWLSYRRIF